MHQDLLAVAGPVAQRLEQGTHNPLVGGSNPSGPTTFITSGLTPLPAINYTDKKQRRAARVQ